MKIEHYTDTPPETVEGVPGVTVRWVIGEKHGAPHFALRVFDVAPGYNTPYHTHWNEHEVFVLAGRGAVRSESGETPLEPGSTVFVPGNELHQFINKGDDLFRFICVVPNNWLQGVERD